MKLHQNFIAVLNPLYKPDRKIKLEKVVEDKMLLEELSKLDKLEVRAIGSSVQNVKVGDYVFVDPMRISDRTPRITIGRENFLFVREGDLILTYEKE